ncbi:hypothetical protein [Sphingobacterium multivorum]|uniref:hypothetical protein n=1 Tax=Sphingobacterium multivorum TaxID=28454 RepID=UPI0028B071D8|nr:hypothetical protein [Sphingobacterium multivorum]
MIDYNTSTTLVKFLYHWSRKEKDVALKILETFIESTYYPNDISRIFDISFTIDFLAQFRLIKPSTVNILDDLDDFIYKKIVNNTNEKLNEIQYIIKVLNHAHTKVLLHGDYDLKYKYRAINYFEILRSLLFKLDAIGHYRYQHKNEESISLMPFLILRLSYISVSTPIMDNANKIFMDYVRYYISEKLEEDVLGDKVECHIRFLIIYLSIKQYNSPIWEYKFQHCLTENLSKYSTSKPQITFLLTILNNKRYELNETVLKCTNFSVVFVNVISSYIGAVDLIIGQLPK